MDSGLTTGSQKKEPDARVRACSGRGARPATAKAAAAAQGKLATRLSPGGRTAAKQMAELACVYDAAPVPRTPEDIISTPARKKKAQAGKAEGRRKPREPQAPGKWLTASVTTTSPGPSACR